MLRALREPLSLEQLKRLQQHKYSSTGKTLIDGYMQPYWEWVVTMCPQWLAPNLMTILGLMVNVLTCAILMGLSPNANHTVSPIWFIFCAVGLFFYQTLDACDGKQARRTGSSSPLGELFDHGCDAISTIFVALGVCVAIKLGEYPFVMLFQCTMAIFLFYCAHWQTYVTGTLRFGKFDVTEAQFSVMAIHLISAIFGQDVWSTKLLFIELRFLPCLSSVVGACIALGSYLCVATSQSTPNVCEGSSYAPLVPALLTFAPSVIMAYKSPPLLTTSPCLFLMTFGLVAVKLTFRLIVAHMTRSELRTWDPTLVSGMAIFLNQYFDYPMNETMLLWFAIVFTVADLLFYADRVCHQICDHLKIELFRISPQVVTDKKNSVDDLTDTGKPLLKGASPSPSGEEKPPAYQDVIHDGKS